MSPLRGYTALINYVERTKKDQYKKAVIYQRLPGAATFENICRRYYKGDVEEINDPVLSEADDYQLDYQVINGRVIIKNGDTLPGEELPDFKNEINNSLNKK